MLSFFRVGGVLECELTLSLDSGGRNGKLLLMYQRFLQINYVKSSRLSDLREKKNNGHYDGRWI